VEKTVSSTSSELKNTILRAGAGAGKTTTLTQVFLKFASDFKIREKRFPRIVVTTFTRKATQELKERLLSKALDEDRQDLFHFVSSKSQVQISTIHGVLSLFLSRYGSAVGLTPDYKILSDLEVRRHARRILRKHVLENPNLQELLEEYEFAVLESALLHYFTEQLVFPNMKFIPKEDLQGMTEEHFSHMKSELLRVARAISTETDNDKWQEYAQSILSFNWNSASLEDVRTFWDFLEKPAYRKASPPFSPELNDDLEDLRKKVGKFLEEPRYLAAFREKHQKNCELFEELAKKFSADFLKLKLEQGLLAMSDLESLSLKTAKEYPEAAARFAKDWDFWMIDEYQDTSPIQVELLERLVGDKPVFIVGDPQQSIYLFRGARSEVFQEKIEQIQAEAGDVKVQLVNYRSSPEVLEFFNHYFGKLGSQFSAMTPAPDKKRSETNDPVVQVILSEEEQKSVVARIQELLNEGVSPEQICILGRTHRVLEEIAKIAKEHGVPLQLHSGSGFYERREVLDALSILKFLLNPHDNANFVALLRSPWFFVPDSEIANFCHHSAHSYWREALKQLEKFPEHHPVKSLKALQALAEEKGLTFTLKRALIDYGLFDFATYVDSSGRREANLWKVVALLSQEERRPGFNFLDFLDASLETLSTDEGGEDADATPVIEPQRVNFMTVHASKGLQFEHVLLIGMGQDPRMAHAPLLTVDEKTGTWSLKIRDEESQAMTYSVFAEQWVEEMRRREGEEFNRVLYVALTRAKSGVSLLWGPKIGKNSWAANSPLNLEEGLHEEKNFSYVVRIGNLEPVPMQVNELSSKDVRSLWQSEKIDSKRKYLSVTELVSPVGNATTGAASEKPSSGEILSRGLARAQQGTEAHRLFESLKYSDFDELLKISDENLKKPLRFIAESKDAPLKQIIEDGFVEWGFALSLNEALLQGQIDLWGQVGDTLWVVDYKTGSQRFSDSAFAQLEIYAWALYKMGYADTAKHVSLAVVYPMDEVVKLKKLSGPSEWGPQFEKKILS
jgi:ATP-dependent helicase/nuclease subunit A